MTDTSAQEPTMEEILASIRRIISEDDAPAQEAPVASTPAPAPAPVAAAPVASPVAAPVIAPVIEDVLELTQPVEPPKPAAPPLAAVPAAAEFDDIEIMPRGNVRQPEPAFSPSAADETLLSRTVAESAASHFGSLAQTVFMPGEGRSLEDVVKELLKPLLKEWLDAHLAAIVEAKVQSEVERISRRRVY
jgi:uncharacterized protein